MIQKSSRWKVLKVFFNFPSKDFQIRQISREIALAPTSVKRYLQEFLMENLILKSEKGVYASYKANRDNDNFKFYKKINTIVSIFESGLIDYLSETADLVILFGSASRGEDIETSDIDLFIQAEETNLNFEKYGKKLNRKIKPFFELNFNKLSKELRNNIINGIVLYGYLKVF